MSCYVQYNPYNPYNCCPPQPCPPIYVGTGPTGPIGATGPQGIKSFVIDHPTKSDNHLIHACLEGPEAGVYYRGTVQICDKFAQGLPCFVEVELPKYVDAFATNFTVQVTPVFEGKLRIANATKVKDNKFRIYGDPGQVDWVVYGSRGYFDVEPIKSSVNVKGAGPYRWI